MTQKVQITVVIDDKDGKFFADLMADKFAWAKYATLIIEAGDAVPQIDATWLLRANVAILENG